MLMPIVIIKTQRTHNAQKMFGSTENPIHTFPKSDNTEGHVYHHH